MIFNKVLVYQYGKVGSSSIRYKVDGAYYPSIKKIYPEYILQTHTHNVAADILNKYNNVLIINIVRLPVDRNISAFWENIMSILPQFSNYTINEINKKYENTEKFKIKKTDMWMNDFFKTTKIDINTFEFNKSQKYTTIYKNNNYYLFFRFEDWSYIEAKILPKCNIFIKEKCNISEKKFYKDFYKKHKKMYKLIEPEITNIKNSKILKIFYSEETIENHIKKYS